MAQHDQAICIRHWDFSETSQTVSLFCRDHGCIRGLAKGARREHGQFGGGIDLLSRGEVGMVLKRDGELTTLTEWDVQETFPTLHDNLTSNRTGWYASDLLGRMLQPADPHPQLFDDTLSLLRALGGTHNSGWSMLRFQWSILKETGWQPDLSHTNDESTTLAFDPTEGRMTADNGQDGAWRVGRPTLLALQSVSSDVEPPKSEDATRRANKLLAAHIRNVLGEEPPTMTWIFGALPHGGQRPRSRQH